ncbi:MAG: hypothetical protein LBU83_05515 [Bacteroidales bacterium]|jgi:hypothetical protein|nr:hypothetical protein [Bacteroidales bacterium]
MAIKILLILFLLSIGVSAETEDIKANIKRNNDFILSNMEKLCKISEKELSAEKYKIDAVPDSSSAVAIALDLAYSKFDARPAVKTGVIAARLIGEHEEYWYVNIYRLMKDYNKVVGFQALISRNSGAFLCGGLTRP